MTTNSTPQTKQEEFSHSAQLALQRLAQAQLALAFLGNDDRASRVSAQLNGVTELVGAMQADQAALLLEQAELQDRIDEGSTRGSDQGLVIERIDREEQGQHGWSKRAAVAWIRLRGLVLLGALCLVLAVVTGVVGHPTAINGPTEAGSETSVSGAAYLGYTMSAGTVDCTLLGVELNAVDQQDVGVRGGPEPLGGQQDDEFLTVYIDLRNTGTRSVPYAPADFHVQVGTGTHMSEELANSDSLGSGELMPGEAVESHLVFAVQRGNHTTELTWEPLTWKGAVEHAWLVDL